MTDATSRLLDVTNHNIPMTDEQRATLQKIWTLIFDWSESDRGMPSLVASDKIERAILSLMVQVDGERDA